MQQVNTYHWFGTVMLQLHSDNDVCKTKFGALGCAAVCNSASRDPGNDEQVHDGSNPHFGQA